MRGKSVRKDRVSLEELERLSIACRIVCALLRRWGSRPKSNGELPGVGRENSQGETLRGEERRARYGRYIPVNRGAWAIPKGQPSYAVE
jgi:hypothetical protein